MKVVVSASVYCLKSTYQPGIARLCACDLGVGKLFGHSE
jgi:hypothetical protein